MCTTHWHFHKHNQLSLELLTNPCWKCDILPYTTCCVSWLTPPTHCAMFDRPDGRSMQFYAWSRLQTWSFAIEWKRSAIVLTLWPKTARDQILTALELKDAHLTFWQLLWPTSMNEPKEMKRQSILITWHQSGTPNMTGWVCIFDRKQRW